MILFSCIVLILFLFSEYNKKLRPLYFYLSLIVLAFILGARAEDIGTDTATYLEYFNYATVGGMEIGWNALSHLFLVLGFNASQFQFFIAFLSFLFILLAINDTLKTTQEKITALFFLVVLGYYFMMFNGMRQYLAVSICLYALNLLSKDKVVFFTIVVIISSLIHLSALICLSALIVFRLKSARLIVLSIVLIITLLVGMFLAKDQLMSILPDRYGRSLLKYGFREDSTFLFFVAIPYNILFIFISTRIKHNKYQLWYKLFFLFLVLQNLTCGLTLGPRITYYFGFSQIIFLSKILHETRSKKDILLKTLLYVYGVAMFIRYSRAEISSEFGVIPYKVTEHFFVQ